MSEKGEQQYADVAKTLGLEQSSGHPRRLWWMLAVVVGVVFSGVLLLFLQRADSVVNYVTAEVQRGHLTITVTATGTLQPVNQVDVGSELSGITDAVEVDYNDRVKVGQVLARLDTDKLQAQTLQSQAALEAAQARVLEAQATVLETDLRSQRCERLTAKKMCSQEDVDTSLAAYKRASAAEERARAQVSEARAKLDADLTNLAKAVIHSPIDGIVLVRNVEPGQTVAATFQAPVLFTLAEDLARMELHVDVDEADVGLVAAGQTATFSVDAYPERIFPARITQVRFGAKEVDGVVTYETLLDVDNSDLSLRPGMTATADITVRSIENALLAPNAALRFTPPVQDKKPSSGGLISQLIRRGPPRSDSRKRKKKGADNKRRRVWVSRDGVPVEMSVTIGATDGVMTEVTGGEVEPGMMLIVDTLDKGR
jgi:HlyD family secretion protein